MKRQIIRIDDSKCNGCGACAPGCPEGALQIINGKARLVNDVYCDGLGACLGTCPLGAITVETREADAYSETLVMERIVKQGPATIRSHLNHLKEHNETGLYNEAVLYLKKHNIHLPQDAPVSACGCPGAESRTFAKPTNQAKVPASNAPSALGHWPIQMHLVSPEAPQYQKADVLLAADCVAFALSDFHSRYLTDHALAIACPRLDDHQELYLQKLTALIDQASINTLHVVIMQVPCCRGLLQLATQAAKQAKRKVPIKCTIIGVQGDVLQEEWVTI